MVDAMVKEIDLSAQRSSAGRQYIETVYFGGGTPSIMNADDLKLMMDALRKCFVFANDIEITLEANPDDITSEKLTEWKSFGINRLSIGIQGFGDEELKWMNRVHTAEDSLKCLTGVTDAGFTNISVDLIYGSPLLTDDEWRRNVSRVIEKNIPHVSCYALTVEPETALHKMILLHKKKSVDPEKQARQFLLLMEWMESAGYEHYEISNFAKPGMRSKHNSSYWSHAPVGNCETYYGFGPSAHSFDGSSRKWNISNNALYIRSLNKGIIPYEEEILTETQKLNEYIMTSLRTKEGLDLNFIKERSGEEFHKRLGSIIKKWGQSGEVELIGSKLVLTRRGKLFADGIASDLFF